MIIDLYAENFSLNFFFIKIVLIVVNDCVFLRKVQRLILWKI
jgi:hypothetical protein